MAERIWLDSCRKWRYENRPEAMDALVRVRVTRRFPDSEKGVYKCHKCGGWHLTRNLQRAINNNAPDLRN